MSTGENKGNMDSDSSQLVKKLTMLITEHYIFPDRSTLIDKLLRQNLENGNYNLPLGSELCDRLSRDLFEASSDKHLRILWHDSAKTSSTGTQIIAELREQFRLANQGIRRVERLLGNIGLIEMTVIPEASSAGSFFSAAMLLVQNTHSL